MMQKRFLKTLCLFSALTLGACDTNVRDQLGLTKESPDEFAVITRAPLEIPPSLALPPPTPGMPRPQETAAINQAKNAVLGNSNQTQTSKSTSAAESILLNKTGADAADPAIRAKVNTETKEMADRNKPVAQKLMNIGGAKDAPSATVVDAKKELERLQKNAAEGKSATDGDTPMIDE